MLPEPSSSLSMWDSWEKVLRSEERKMGWTQGLVWVLSRRLLQSSNVSIEQDGVVVGLQNDSRNLQFLENFFIPVVILVISPREDSEDCCLNHSDLPQVD